jgi:hypothetical protein
MESIQDVVNKFTPQQKQQFDDAVKASDANRYSDAFATYKQLLTQLQGDVVLSKFAAEAALNASDTTFALTTLKPVALADPDDWQAATLLARACAESGDTTCRDSQMVHVLDLHRRGITPPRLQQYTVEHIKAGENTLVIWASLEPWGYYKVYNLGQLIDPQGRIFFRISLESNDADQPLFASQHPKEASNGARSFSLDAYRETGLNSSGQRTQTHYTYKFFAGQPSYQTIRNDFIQIANEKSTPISSRNNLVP